LGSEQAFPQHLEAIRVEAARPGRSAYAALRRTTETMRTLLSELEDVIADMESSTEDPHAGVVALSQVELDPVIERVEALQIACEELLHRPLRGGERTIVLNWALLERDGVLVPVAEILDLVGHLMSRPTPDGTLPSSLKWCDMTVQTLARAPVALLRGRGARGRAAEVAQMYRELADRLDHEEVTS
jgi:hypothetical protein